MSTGCEASQANRWKYVCQGHAELLAEDSFGYVGHNRIYESLRTRAQRVCTDAADQKGENMKLNLECVNTAELFYRSMRNWTEGADPSGAL